ncbi:MAG: hypothetical protein P0Y66_06220 [Candidatus Kaistia colombiensis]|nr:MAG: hypothetical protein P0Y66_06220 [Kaistia sp.]
MTEIDNGTNKITKTSNRQDMQSKIENASATTTRLAVYVGIVIASCALWFAIAKFFL